MSNSIGDLRNSGLQGNNFPWQLKMLQGLQALIDGNCCEEILTLLTQIESDTTKISNFLGPATRTHNIRRTSAAGTIVKPYSFSIANVGTANGTVEGATLAPGETINFDAGVLNNDFGTINYDPTTGGTEFLITYVD
jgi:hypothetical protein